MTDSRRIGVIVLALNEEERLEDTVVSVVEAAKESGGLEPQVVIVNDGSTDGTPAAIARLEGRFPFVRSLHNPVNLGIGESMKRALPLLTADKFIAVPGDNDMPRRLLVDMFRNSDKADMVMSYFLNKESRGYWRNLLSMTFSVIHITAFRLYVQYVNGPVIYPTAKVRELRLRSRRFSIASEITTKLLRRGCSYCEVAGYMQTGTAGSSAVSFKNLREVVGVFLRLFLEVHVFRRAYYNRVPRRVQI